MHGAVLFGILVYIGVRYVGASVAVRSRLRRGLAMYWAAWLSGLLVVAESVAFQLVIDPVLIKSGAIPFLPARESEVLRMVLVGMDNQNIASHMNLTPGTVKVHVHNILRKTGQKDRQELRRHFCQKS